MFRDSSAGDNKDNTKKEISPEFDTALHGLYMQLKHIVTWAQRYHGSFETPELSEQTMNRVRGAVEKKIERQLSLIPLIKETMRALEKLKEDAKFSNAKTALEKLRIEVENTDVPNIPIAKMIKNFYNVLDPLIAAGASNAPTPSSQVAGGRVDDTTKKSRPPSPRGSSS